MIRRLSQDYKLANERLDFVLGFIIWDFKSKTKASRNGPYRGAALVAWPVRGTEEGSGAARLSGTALLSIIPVEVS